MVILFNILIFLFFQKSVNASQILINEFLVDPQPQQVEILNIGSQSADVSSWIIDDSGGKTFFTIPENTIIFSNTCLVFSGDFNLNKTSTDTIRLFNSQQELIDSFSYDKSPGLNISFQRLPDASQNWATKEASLGFFNEDLTTCFYLSPTPQPSPTNYFSPTPTINQILITPTPTINKENNQQTPVSYNNLFLSEVMVNPETGDKEWVEIYNNNPFEVNLINWFIDDIENSGSSPKSFSLTIPGQSLAIIELTSAMFNNSGDSVRLLDFNKEVKDSFDYQSSEKNISWGRVNFEDDYWCQQTPSKQAPNNSCLNLEITSPTPLVSSIKKISPPITKQNQTSLSSQKKFLSVKKFSLTNQQFSSNVLGVTDQTNQTKKTTPISLSKTFSLISLINSSFSFLSLLIKIGNKIKI